ncbi:hypothetical protein [Natrinema salsiterrestre]|uniref:Uncharacterized protein n=1 Tax=Natrinema salsiterrestre TaxID=2950540 RepID=A0A9Q4PZR8_9EURY|nr:hypothetical protein [Natrinema salsiterrestre]MDF9744734.1 hypothetical protein [Natrinema salsiterrestre]
MFDRRACGAKRWRTDRFHPVTNGRERGPAADHEEDELNGLGPIADEHRSKSPSFYRRCPDCAA